LHKEENIGGAFIVCAICPGNEALKNGLEKIVLSFKSRVYSDILLRQNREDMGNILILSANNEVILDSDGIEDLYMTFPDHPISDGSRTIENDQGKFLLLSHLMPYMGMRIVKIFDYATLTASRNLFGQEAAAMYMMGSWELGLATDENFSENFRNNVRAFKIPAMGRPFQAPINKPVSSIMTGFPHSS